MFKRTEARVRNGLVQASRRQVFEKICHLVSPLMPFANLLDTHKTRWGDELRAEKMKECVWLRPEAVAQIEFLDWTAGNRLRHSKFVGMREGKDARQVVKEHAGEYWAYNRETSKKLQWYSWANSALVRRFQ